MRKKIIAMLLAGGQGSRLGVLTQNMAKPAVPFAGKYRIIDFPLSNCVNSNIDTVGVLTQYQPLELHSYIGTGQPWDLDRNHGGVYVLPPFIKGQKGEWYSGTANAIYQNMSFIDQFSPQYLLVLSGDHVYKMDYAAMLKNHEDNAADATIAVIEVPMAEAHRYGVLSTEKDSRITAFEEKPKKPKSNKASMGVYIFTWEVLKRYLIEDAKNPKSNNDFGQDIIPSMLDAGQKIYAYAYHGYWKDVGTIESLWQANMDLLENSPELDMYDPTWRIYGRNPIMPPHVVSADASISRSFVTEGCVIRGSVSHSVLFAGVLVDEGAVVVDSVIMPGVHIGKNARVFKAIIGERVKVGQGASIGGEPAAKMDGQTGHDSITVIGEDAKIGVGQMVPCGEMMDAGNRANTGEVMI